MQCGMLIPEDPSRFAYCVLARGPAQRGIGGAVRSSIRPYRSPHSSIRYWCIAAYTRPAPHMPSQTRSIIRYWSVAAYSRRVPKRPARRGLSLGIRRRS
eukprot:262898-Rhodomonas_salina.1